MAGAGERPGDEMMISVRNGVMWMDEKGRKGVLGALQKDGDHYRGACSVQVLHGGGDAGATPAAAADVLRMW